MTTEQVFATAVGSLGEHTAEEIVELVRKAGIKGRPSTSYQCPMAKLLNLQCGVKTNVVGVGKKYIIRKLSGDRVERIKTPKSVTKFLVNFDIGKYPDLFAPPPRATKSPADKRKGDRHVAGYKRKPVRKRKVSRSLVALLGGRGFRAE